MERGEILELLASIVEDIRRRSGIPFPSPLPNTARRFRELITECIALRKRVLAAPEDSPEMLDLAAEAFELEGHFRELRARLLLFPAFLVVYVGFALLFFILSYVDVTGFIKTTLGVEAPEKLVAFGVAGAFLYLATSTLQKITVATRVDSQFAMLLAFSIRLSLAIIVPIILVSLFFKKDGAMREFEVSPELLSFLCGYSSKLVVDAFSKLVEKGTKMIEAL